MELFLSQATSAKIILFAFFPLFLFPSSAFMAGTDSRETLARCMKVCLYVWMLSGLVLFKLTRLGIPFSFLSVLQEVDSRWDKDIIPVGVRVHLKWGDVSIVDMCSLWLRSIALERNGRDEESEEKEKKKSREGGIEKKTRALDRFEAGEKSGGGTKRMIGEEKGRERKRKKTEKEARERGCWLIKRVSFFLQFFAFLG